MNGRSFAEDAIIFVVLLAVLCIPLLVLPSPLRSLTAALGACLRSVGFVFTLVILLVLVLILALVAEQLHQKWFPSTTATKTNDVDDPSMRTPFGRKKTLQEKYDKRKQKEEKFQHELENVVKPAGKSWSLTSNSSSRQRRNKNGGDAIELTDLSKASGMVRRAPPPPPPL
ncbi:hypothetical protein OIO90_002100 [Microbotryomycetes sp. JL221]|nr:hypothetical protein OIO90_002100 [Microbotryomycetes sp. JL221]